ncbi:hypothetical protein D3C73_1059780 [compost metagenome]
MQGSLTVAKFSLCGLYSSPMLGARTACDRVPRARRDGMIVQSRPTFQVVVLPMLL